MCGIKYMLIKCHVLFYFINTFVYVMNVLFNGKVAIEPRIAMRWALNNSNSVHVGYGKHSVTERLHNYYSKVKLEDGSVVEPNHDLDLLKAHHFVLGYEKRFTENLMVKVEAYFQYLYNLPVENLDTSYYATINEGVEYRYVDLVNKGRGRNFGIELTLERFFANSYYYLINASLYNSKDELMFKFYAFTPIGEVEKCNKIYAKLNSLLD